MQLEVLSFKHFAYTPVKISLFFPPSDVEELVSCTDSPTQNKNSELHHLRSKVEGLQDIIRKQTETMQRMLQAAQANSEVRLVYLFFLSVILVHLK